MPMIGCTMLCGPEFEAGLICEDHGKLLIRNPRLNMQKGPYMICPTCGTFPKRCRLGLEWLAFRKEAGAK